MSAHQEEAPPPARAGRVPPRVGVEHVLCAVCGSDDPSPYRRGMYRVGERLFDLVRCRVCGLVYVDPRPDAATLAWMYDDPEYFVDGYNLGVEDECYFDRGEELLAQYDGEVARLEAEVGGRGRMLELGSAGGFFLEAARRRGWEVQGVELSPVAARFSREELGLEVFEGWLEEAPFAAASFDVAICDNVLEHTLSPLGTLRTLARLVRPGGHVLLVVPSYVNSPWFRTLLALGELVPRRFLGEALVRILKLEGDAGHPYHVLEFDRRTLRRLVGRAGLELVDLEGSVPLPAAVFKRERTARTLLLRAAFRALDAGMRARLLPPARLRALLRVPQGSRTGV